MLVLTRKKRQQIMIGDDIKVKVIRVRDDHVDLGIEAPTGISVHRQEIYDKVRGSKPGLASAGL